MNDAHWLLIIRDRKCFLWNSVFHPYPCHSRMGFSEAQVWSTQMSRTFCWLWIRIDLWSTSMAPVSCSILPAQSKLASWHKIHTLGFIATDMDQAAFFGSGPASIQPSWAGFEEVASWTAGGLVFRVPKWSLFGVPIQAGYRPQVPILDFECFSSPDFLIKKPQVNLNLSTVLFLCGRPLSSLEKVEQERRRRRRSSCATELSKKPAELGRGVFNLPFSRTVYPDSLDHPPEDNKSASIQTHIVICMRLSREQVLGCQCWSIGRACFSNEQSRLPTLLSGILIGFW